MSLCKIFWAWILLSLTAAWLPGLSSAAPAASDRVNILFIAIDDLNDWVGFLARSSPGEDAEHGPPRGARHGVCKRALRCAALLPVAGRRVQRS